MNSTSVRRPQGGAHPNGTLQKTERLFIERILTSLYPRLQRHDLFPWNLLQGPLIPDFLMQYTRSDFKRIVEVNCRDGVLTNTLALLFPDIEIIGIDPSAKMIARARATIGNRQNIKFICGNAATMLAIPCDRIIYNRCLTKRPDKNAFKTLVAKTAPWIQPNGDLIVRESPLRLACNPGFLKHAFSELREQKSIHGYMQSLLGEMNYENQKVFHSRPLPGFCAETFYYIPKNVHLANSQAQVPDVSTTGEWQDFGDQSVDSVVGFLFANQSDDFSRELD